MFRHVFASWPERRVKRFRIQQQALMQTLLRMRRITKAHCPSSASGHVTGSQVDWCLSTWLDGRALLSHGFDRERTSLQSDLYFFIHTSSHLNLRKGWKRQALTARNANTECGPSKNGGNPAQGGKETCTDRVHGKVLSCSRMTCIHLVQWMCSSLGHTRLPHKTLTGCALVQTFTIPGLMGKQ